MIPINFQNFRGQTLVGKLSPGPLPTPIIMVHGFGSTKEENGKFDKIAKIINREGYPVFQFDFAGCGESDYQAISHQSEIEDLISAINFLESQGFKQFALFGHSMGGLISAKVMSEPHIENRIKAIVLLAAATQSMQHWWEEQYSDEQIKKLKKEGELTIPTPHNQFQKSFTISSNMLEESKNINQKELLEEIRCPVLLIHGDEDNLVPLKQSVDAMQFLSEESELVTLKGANHFFEKHIEELSEISVDFFNNYLRK